MKFFQPNLNRTGRVVRAAFGLLCLGAAWLLWEHSPVAGRFLTALGILGLIEAARGWCLARAVASRPGFKLASIGRRNCVWNARSFSVEFGLRDLVHN